MAIVCRRGVTSVGKATGFDGMAYQIGGIRPICAAGDAQRSRWDSPTYDSWRIGASRGKADPV